MAYNIKMLRGTQEAYTALNGSRNADALYFCTDSGNVYLGDKQLTGKVAVGAKPGTGVPGVLYIENNIPYVWDATTTAYVRAMPEMVTAITAGSASETKLVSEKAVVDYVSTASSGDHAAVEQLKTRMDTAEGDIDTLEGRATALESGKADKGDSLADYGITDAYTKGETDSKIDQKIAASQHLTKVVLGDEEDLPEPTEATQNAIYMKKVTGGSGNQYYEEFIVVDDKWEKIGDTAVDLSNYATQSWVTSQIQPVSTKADANEAAIGVINGSGEGSINKAKTDAVAEAKSYADGLAGNYATAAQGAKADTALQKADIAEGATNGTIAVKGTDVAVHGLKSAAYADTTAFDAAGAATAAETAAKQYTDTALTWGSF